MATVKRENYSNIYGKNRKADPARASNAKRPGLVDADYESDDDEKKPKLEGKDTCYLLTFNEKLAFLKSKIK